MKGCLTGFRKSSASGTKSSASSHKITVFMMSSHFTTQLNDFSTQVLTSSKQVINCKSHSLHKTSTLRHSFAPASHHKSTTKAHHQTSMKTSLQWVIEKVLRKNFKMVKTLVCCLISMQFTEILWMKSAETSWVRIITSRSICTCTSTTATPKSHACQFTSVKVVSSHSLSLKITWTK